METQPSKACGYHHDMSKKVEKVVVEVEGQEFEEYHWHCLYCQYVFKFSFEPKSWNKNGNFLSRTYIS